MPKEDSSFDLQFLVDSRCIEKYFSFENNVGGSQGVWGFGARLGVCMYRLKKLPPQKSSTPHVCIHASIPSKILTISQAFIHHSSLFQSINTPRCLTNYIHIYPRSCNDTRQDKKHLLAFLRLTSSIHAACYTRQAFLTLIPIKK
jgi:hypothetical protein